MSSYIKNTKNPKTGEFEPAMWLDDYFGHHHYGVMWQGGGMVDPERVKLETNDEPVDATFDSFDTQGIEHSEQSRKQSQDTASLLQSNQVDAVDELLVPFATTKDASELLLAYCYKNNCTVSQAIRDKFSEELEKQRELLR